MTSTKEKRVMTQEQKDKLKNIPKTRCSKCGSPKHYRNPMARCYECGKKFCFDHIFGGMVNSKMKYNEEVRDVCAECKEKHSYKKL